MHYIRLVLCLHVLFIVESFHVTTQDVCIRFTETISKDSYLNFTVLGSFNKTFQKLRHPFVSLVNDDYE